MYWNNTFFHFTLPSRNINSTKRSNLFGSWWWREDIKFTDVIIAYQNKAKLVHQEPKAVPEKAQCSVLSSPKQFAANKQGKNLQSQVLRSAFSEHQELAVLCRDNVAVMIVGKVKISISQSTDFYFAKYRFPFRKVQIFISQSTDFKMLCN